MAQFLPAYQIPRNAMLDVSGLSNAISEIGQNRRKDEQTAYDRSHDAEVMGMRRQEFAGSQQDREERRRLQRVQSLAGLAQMVDGVQDPQQRAQQWSTLLQSDPRLVRSLPEQYRDPMNGPRFLIAEARGYQDPMARQQTQADIDYKRAQTANLQRGQIPDLIKAGDGRLYDPSTGQWVIAPGMEPGGTNSPMTKGQEAMDREFAKEYVDWQARGGYADVQKTLRQLDGAISTLKKGKNVTGPTVGNYPDWYSSLGPEGRQRVATREAVEEVVQRNLRLVLGAQFTEKEGERLIARAYNPRLGQAENARRVRRLMESIQSAAQAKQSASEYFQQNGTLRGWNGRVPTAQEIEASIDGDAGTQTPQPEQNRYQNMSNDDLLRELGMTP